MKATLRTAFRFLTFRATREELLATDGRHLAFGLVFTWLAGMGRYWDSPDAHLVQSTGLVSLILVFALALLLWLVVLPLRPRDWTYTRVLTFVTLTAPPALLYALPVERWVTLADARAINVWFLAVVAAWRVGLFGYVLARYARLGWAARIVGTVLPLTLVVAALTALNLERAAFNIMSGLDPVRGTAADSAYAVLVTLTVFSVMGFLPLLLSYLVLCYLAWRRARATPASPPPASPGASVLSRAPAESFASPRGRV